MGTATPQVSGCCASLVSRGEDFLEYQLQGKLNLPCRSGSVRLGERVDSQPECPR